MVRAVMNIAACLLPLTACAIHSATAGSFTLPLPVGSVCVLKGNAADVAKHAIPSVPQKRVSLTFRKISGGKRSLARTVPFGGHDRDVLE